MADPVEILSSQQMAAADNLAVALGMPSHVLMENAGQAVADEAERMVAPGARVVVLCGPGNNGGDGYVAARHLMVRGYDVGIVALLPRSRLVGDAATMAARWKGPVHPVGSAELARADLIIDALFGTGLTRAPAGEAADLITRVNRSGRPVLSVDVPSGLDSDSGEAPGVVVFPDRVVTFFRLKQGHVTGRGAGLCRVIAVADIGIPTSAMVQLGPLVERNDPARWLGQIPVPDHTTHKYRRGHAVVVSGPAEATGAARLAARAALRIGSGLVTVASPEAALAVNAASLTAIMVRPFAGPAGLSEILADERKNVVLIGPGAGVGAETRALIDAALETSAALVLDADALTTLAVEPSAVASSLNSGASAARLGGSPARIVMTPHEGEMTRLFPSLKGSRLERARDAARLSGAVVVLKGASTIIAAPSVDKGGARVVVNTNAPPWLATAGTGDVLAGFIAGLIAQGMPAFEASAAAVWMHGAAASRFGPGLIAEDLPDTLPGVLRDLYAMRSAGAL
ncbi:MAG: NAD(P)H-hydrate dehydratase [Hyphomicrobiaceae bacterium]|nr:NAD(P)H-hydrate dehydratase [Hyphomicrobiaceae bacterium]